MSAHAGYDVALVDPELIEDPELRAAPPILASSSAAGVDAYLRMPAEAPGCR